MLGSGGREKTSIKYPQYAASQGAKDLMRSNKKYIFVIINSVTSSEFSILSVNLCNLFVHAKAKFQNKFI